MVLKGVMAYIETYVLKENKHFPMAQWDIFILSSFDASIPWPTYGTISVLKMILIPKKVTLNHIFIVVTFLWEYHSCS